MADIKLSVIIPVYNASEFLGDCIESLLEQGFDSKEYEIVCVDDGSTDNSLDILKDYAKRYSFIVVYQKENGGVASTRNYGIEKARGEYIAFVDSDDFICSNTLAKLVSEAKTRDVVGVRFGYSCIKENDKFMRESDKEFLFTMKEICADDAPFQVWGMLLKKELVMQADLRFNKIFRTREDYIFNYLLFAYHEKKKMLITDAPVYKYRVREGSLSHIMSYQSETFQCERLENMLDYIRECERFVVEHLDCSETTKHVIRNKITYFAATALLCSLRCKSIKAKEVRCLLKSMGVYPYKWHGIVFNKQMLIKMLITSFPICNVLDYCGLLRRKTINE